MSTALWKLYSFLLLAFDVDILWYPNPVAFVALTNRYADRIRFTDL